MKITTLRVCFLALCAMVLGSSGRAATIDFSDITLAPNSYNDGRPSANPALGTYDGSFTSGGASFSNSFTQDNGFSYYSGWAKSNRTLATPAPNTYPEGSYDPAYQFSVRNGGTGNYGIVYLTGFGDQPLTLPAGTTPTSMQVNNTNYALLALRDGGGGARAFGPGDFFLLTITGLNASNQAIGTPVNFYMANFLNGNSTVIDSWTTVDLSSLAGASKLSFAMTSSDNGQFGINTPTFFAMDNLVVTAIPEPGTLAGLFCFAAGFCCWRHHRRTN